MGTARDNLIAYRDGLVAELDNTGRTMMDMRQKMVRGVNLQTAERWQYSLATLQSKMQQQKTLLSTLNMQLAGRGLNEATVHEFASLEQALKDAQQDLADTIRMLQDVKRRGGSADKVYTALKKNASTIDQIQAKRKNLTLATTTEGTMSVKRFTEFVTEANVLTFPSSKWQKSPEPVKAAKPEPKAAAPKAPTSETELDNDYCHVRYSPKDKQITVMDKVDQNNLPAAYTKTKRGIEKTWAAVAAAMKHSKPKFRDVTGIFTETGQQYHYWCRMD